MVPVTFGKKKRRQLQDLVGKKKGKPHVLNMKKGRGLQFEGGKRKSRGIAVAYEKYFLEGLGFKTSSLCPGRKGGHEESVG